MNLSNIDLRPLLLGYPVLLLSLTVHECAHAWTAWKLGDPTARSRGRITLNPIPHMDLFGTLLFPILSFISHIPLLGWAKPVPVDPRYFRKPSRDNMFVSLAGPLSNVLLFCFFFGLFALFVRFAEVAMDPRFAQPVELLLLYGVLINAFLAVFNLIPLPPLDGSHILEHFLPYQARQAYLQIQPFGFIILIFLFYLGAMDLLFTPVMNLLQILLSWVS